MIIAISSLRRLRRRLAGDQRGVTAIITGFGLLVLLGFAGMAIDVGHWQLAAARMQGAADRAAAAGTTTLLGGGTVAKMIIQSRAIAANSGFVHNSLGTTVTVNRPPTAGPNQGNNYAVEVVIRQTQPLWFSSIFLSTAPAIQMRAVALPGILSDACLLALHPTANNAIDVSGNPTISAPDCVVVSDSNSSSAVHLQGSASLTAATVVTPGNLSFTGGSYTLTLGQPALTGAQSVADPYAGTLTHAALTAGMPTSGACTKTGSLWSGNCIVSSLPINSNYTLSANTRISGPWLIKNQTVDLSPGTYWITDGDLNLQSGSGATLKCTTCAAGGAGVTIILTTAQTSGGTVGTLTLASNANLTLSAPNTGTFAGKVIIQDSNGLPTGTTIHTTSNAQANAVEVLSGLVYFPQTAISFQGGPDTGVGPKCLVLVASTIMWQGNPTFVTSGCGAVGLTQLPKVPTKTRVVE